MIEVTDEMRRAFEVAWSATEAAESVMGCAEHDMGDCPYHEIPGSRLGAGLAAVLAIVERDHAIRPRRKVDPRWACRHCGSPLEPCETCREPSQCGDDRARVRPGRRPMSQSTSAHRRDIWAGLCIGYDAVSHILWTQALDAGQAVGTCTSCGQLNKPMAPEQRGQRMFYPAKCVGCQREVEGQGPRPAKKGAA